MALQHVAKIFEIDGFHNVAQYAVLLNLAYRADRKGIVRFTQSEIAQHTTLSPRTVGRWFQHFQEVGLLERIGHGRYRLEVAMLDMNAPDTLFTPTPEVERRTGATEELERLKALQQPGEAIVWTADGWPHLSRIPEHLLAD